MSSFREKLIESFRSGETRIDLDHAELLLPDTSRVVLNVPAFVVLKDRHLSLHFRESAPHQLPSAALSAFAKDVSGKVITADDYLTIEAVTDQGLPVRLEDVSPYFSNVSKNFVSRGGVITHRLTGFHRLALLPVGQESMTPGERHSENLALGLTKTDQKSPFWPEDEEEGFYALIPGVKLQLSNRTVSKSSDHPFHRGSGFKRSVGCFVGQVLGGECCLEQTDAGDVSLNFRRSSRTTETEPSLKKVSEALLAAFGLMHTCNPWPYYYSEWHERRLIERWLKAPADCQRDCLEPLHVCIMDQNAERFFENAATFFATGGTDAEYYRQALWLIREACRKGAPLEVRLITFCSVLEGVAKRFTKSGKQIGDETEWKVAISKAGISWEDAFDSIYESYRAYRNKLAHGFDPHPADEKSPDVIFNAYSRITAGIYILMAKRMGFTGTLWRSRLEGEATISLAPLSVKGKLGTG